MRAALLGLILSACGAERAPAALAWTFGGGRDCASALVSHVRVQLFDAKGPVGPGPLGAEVEYPCAQGEVTLAGLAAGRYGVRARGVVHAETTYRIETEVQIEPSRPRATVDLLPLFDRDLEVAWTFAGMTCEDAGVDTVRVGAADGGGGAAAEVPCAEGLRIVDARAGEYLMLFEVRAADGAVLYGQFTSLEIGSGPMKLIMDLFPQPGAEAPLVLRWSFEGGPGCEAAGVRWVSWAMRAVNDDTVYASGGASCTQGEATLPPQTPGYYRIGVTGYGEPQQQTHRGGRVVALRAGTGATVDLLVPRL